MYVCAGSLVIYDDSCKSKRELDLTLPPPYLHQLCVLKSNVGRKSKHCPDPNETGDKFISHEFPDK